MDVPFCDRMSLLYGSVMGGIMPLRPLAMAGGMCCGR